MARLPLTQNGGVWDSGHVQGVAVDVQGGYIYYSFTKLLAKYDFDGKLIGTLDGWTGHLGDLAFNPADGKIYGSLEYKADQAFYIAVIDVAQLDRDGVEASRAELFRTVYLPEVTRDYSADMNGDGRFDGDRASLDHRYGASGIDGVALGPAFGRVDGPMHLTVAHGVYGDTARADNDHQVLLQYDINDWSRYASPLSEAAPHRNGPASAEGQYFVRTGGAWFGAAAWASPRSTATSARSCRGAACAPAPIGTGRSSTVYWYRFIAPDGARSETGRTKTLPVGRVDRFRLGCSSAPIGRWAGSTPIPMRRRGTKWVSGCTWATTSMSTVWAPSRHSPCRAGRCAWRKSRRAGC